MARSRAARLGIADSRRSLRSCLAGSWLARQSWAVARRVVAVLVLLACVLAVGCGGQEPSAHRGPTVKMPRSAPVAEGSGRFVAIGGGRSLYMQCVGSG